MYKRLDWTIDGNFDGSGVGILFVESLVMCLEPEWLVNGQE